MTQSHHDCVTGPTRHRNAHGVAALTNGDVEIYVTVPSTRLNANNKVRALRFDAQLRQTQVHSPFVYPGRHSVNNEQRAGHDVTGARRFTSGIAPVLSGSQ